MRLLIKTISIILLICFTFTNVSFASDVNSFKLSPPSSFSSLKESEFKESAQVQIGIHTSLKELRGELTIESLQKLGTCQFSEKTVFSSKITGVLYFNEAGECVVSGKNITIEAGCYIVRAEVNSKVYYCLISKEGRGHTVSVVPERVISEALTEGTVKFTHGSISEKDREAINAYLEHEVTTENNTVIDEWIAEHMARGEYAVDSITAVENPLYDHVGKHVYTSKEYMDILDSTDSFLMKLGVSEENRRKISEIMSRTPLVFIPYDSKKTLPEIKIGGRVVKVTAHSSQFATYIFLPRTYYQSIEKGAQWAHSIAPYVTSNLVHEIGARCGKKK